MVYPLCMALEEPRRLELPLEKAIAPLVPNRRVVAVASAAGNHAAVVGDDYIRITVFLAAVLFLVGIGSTFKLHTIRYALITIGSLLLILATVLILQQPGLPS